MAKSALISRRAKGCFLVLVLLAGFSTAACAKDKTPKKEEKTASKEEVVQASRQIQAQEIRLVVLQQLFNQEAAVLKQKHTVFCQAHNLDEEKFKKGLYQYDQATGKFSEKPVVPTTPEKK